MHRLAIFLLCLLLHVEPVAACEPGPLTVSLVQELAQRTELMSEVAAQKADFALVFDSDQEVASLEATMEATQGTTLPTVPAVILTQILADCAKHEQEAHIQGAVNAAEEAGHDGAGEMYSSYESLEDVRELLAQLNEQILQTWQVVSQPGGEWDQVGCRCAHANLEELFATTFQPVAVGQCSHALYSDMLVWVLLSASETCRI